MLSAIGRAATRRAGIGAVRPFVTERSCQLQRVSITQSLRDTTQQHSSRGSQATPSAKRRYATASKAPVKPRAKGATKTTKSTTARKASKAAAKNPKAKPKKKATTKRKTPVRKPLTEEQKAKRAEVKSKTQLKELKATALLAQPKKLPATAWSVLFTEEVKEKKSQQGKDFSGVTSIITSAATRYKNLDASEREHYNHIANQNKATNEAKYQEWVASHTPEQIRVANAARSRLKHKEAKPGSKSFTAIEDPRLPKRPRNARALFTAERWASGDLKGIGFTDASKTLQEDWLNLSAQEKKRYEDEAAGEKTRYAQEYHTVYKHALPTHGKAASATA